MRRSIIDEAKSPKRNTTTMVAKKSIHASQGRFSVIFILLFILCDFNFSSSFLTSWEPGFVAVAHGRRARWKDYLPFHAELRGGSPSTCGLFG